MMERKIKWLRQLITEESKTWNTIKGCKEALDGFLWGASMEEFENLEGDEDWKAMEERLILQKAGIENFNFKQNCR